MDKQKACRSFAFLLPILLVARIAVAATTDPPDLVCYRIDDPLVISGTVVTSSADLGVSPPCHIDTGATRLCVRAGTNDGEVELATGLLNCTNGYTQSATGTLQTAVGGTDPSLIGRLQANTVTLDGDLALDITGGYTPQLGDTFSVLGYTSRSGAFATISGTSLGNGLSAQETYGATALTFEVQ